MHRLGEIVIIGGGCYGSFYLEQLIKAREAGAVEWRRLLVIDRDPACQVARESSLRQGCELVASEWGEFLDGWLVAGDRGDADRLVPSPLMPHLMAEWLLRRASEAWPDRHVALVPADRPAGTPFEFLNDRDGVRYLSHADWTCPVHCIEPATCPVIKAPRKWEMGDTVTRWTVEQARRQPTAGPVLFTCRHLTHGVGMYPVTQGFAALRELARLVDGHGRGDLVVGSISACHGAVALLSVESEGTRVPAAGGTLGGSLTFG